MGEYEPDDSRNVTQRDGPEPGGIKRTGPREYLARANAKVPEKEDEEDGARPDEKGKPMPGQQQRQKQSDSQSGMKPQQGEESPLAGNQKQAIDNEVGSARPEYDQYEVNQPSSLARDRDVEEQSADAARGARDPEVARGDADREL